MRRQLPLLYYILIRMHECADIISRLCAQAVQQSARNTQKDEKISRIPGLIPY